MKNKENHVGTAGASLSPPRRDASGSNAIDQREALFNSGATGSFKDVMVQRHEVTLIRGILLEIDGECLRVGDVITRMPADGFELYEQNVRVWLDNHPVLRKAEVRFSGRWLHCILWFDSPVEIKSDRQRERWDVVVTAVQRTVPSDPEAPSLLAMTRPVGSVNSKSGREVELIKAGEPVSEQEILSFADDLTHRSFATVTQILFGSTTVSPCPICHEQESTLSSTSPRYRASAPKIVNRGSCYHCGSVPLRDVILLVLKGRGDTPEPEERGNNSSNTSACKSTVNEPMDTDCPF